LKRQVADAFRQKPARVRYGSGRHIAPNGAEFGQQEGLFHVIVFDKIAGENDSRGFEVFGARLVLNSGALKCKILLMLQNPTRRESACRFGGLSATPPYGQSANAPATG
jgi:hypothetical protein